MLDANILFGGASLMDTFDDLWEEAEATRRDLVAAGATTGFVAGFALSGGACEEIPTVPEDPISPGSLRHTLAAGCTGFPPARE
jgi:hypothetical protein